MRYDIKIRYRDIYTRKDITGDHEVFRTHHILITKKYTGIMQITYQAYEYLVLITLLCSPVIEIGDGDPK